MVAVRSDVGDAAMSAHSIQALIIMRWNRFGLRI
jgi:hypothetical protein